MKQNLTIKGKLSCIGMRLNQKSKSRQINSSLGYFDLGSKTVVPYNLKNFLRSLKMNPSVDSGKVINSHGLVTLTDKINNRRKMNPQTTDSLMENQSRLVSFQKQSSSFSLELPLGKFQEQSGRTVAIGINQDLMKPYEVKKSLQNDDT